MLYHGSKAGAFDLKTVVLESIASMRRAGVCVYILYTEIQHTCIYVILQVQRLSFHTTLQIC